MAGVDWSGQCRRNSGRTCVLSRGNREREREREEEKERWERGENIGKKKGIRGAGTIICEPPFRPPRNPLPSKL